VIADLEQLDGVGDALQPPVPKRLDALRNHAQREAGVGAQQRLPAEGDRHHPCGDRQRQAVDLDRLGAAGNVGGAVLAQRHRADMQAGTGLERQPECGQCAMVGQRVADRIGGPVEQQQHAVGLVDLAAAPDRQQVARGPVVGGPECRHRGVAERLGQPGAVDDIGQQQGVQGGHRWRARRVVDDRGPADAVSTPGGAAATTMGRTTECTRGQSDDDR
jgi:hypothetical protein